MPSNSNSNIAATLRQISTWKEEFENGKHFHRTYDFIDLFLVIGSDTAIASICYCCAASPSKWRFFPLFCLRIFLCDFEQVFKSENLGDYVLAGNVPLWTLWCQFSLFFSLSALRLSPRFFIFIRFIVVALCTAANMHSVKSFRMVT